MGLDMYAYSVKKTDASNEAQQDDFCGEFGHLLNDLQFDENSQPIVEGVLHPIHYWRKHHDLHGHMVDIARGRGFDDSFNCYFLHLSAGDLDCLEQAIVDEDLPPTSGFFFGNNPPDDESKTDDLAFICKARKAIEDGHLVYYFSWW